MAINIEGWQSGIGCPRAIEKGFHSKYPAKESAVHTKCIAKKCFIKEEHQIVNIERISLTQFIANLALVLPLIRDKFLFFFSIYIYVCTFVLTAWVDFDTPVVQRWRHIEDVSSVIACRYRYVLRMISMMQAVCVMLSAAFGWRCISRCLVTYCSAVPFRLLSATRVLTSTSCKTLRNLHATTGRRIEGLLSRTALSNPHTLPF